jgi:hypothetical protein
MLPLAELKNYVFDNDVSVDYAAFAHEKQCLVHAIVVYLRTPQKRRSIRSGGGSGGNDGMPIPGEQGGTQSSSLAPLESLQGAPSLNHSPKAAKEEKKKDVADEIEREGDEGDAEKGAEQEEGGANTANNATEGDDEKEGKKQGEGEKGVTDGEKAVLDYFKLSHFPISVTKAVVRWQALSRQKIARRALAEHVQNQGMLLALPGTIQGKSGWYEVVTKGGQRLACKYTVTEEKDWSMAQRPVPMHLFNELYANKKEEEEEEEKGGEGVTGEAASATTGDDSSDKQELATP